MTGGVLQLVAKGIEDLYLNGNADITFFKTIYRRHTNFSTDIIDLNFANNLTFGVEGKCKIKKMGDLLHRLNLSIQLPEIQAVFSALTVGAVKSLLSGVQITWSTTKTDNSLFTQTDYTTEVKPLIDQKIIDVNHQLATDNSILASLFGTTDPLYPYIWFNNTGHTNQDVAAYMNDVINSIFNFGQYNLQYKFINAQLLDRIPPLTLANASVLQQMLFTKFLNYATGASSIAGTMTPVFDPNSYNDENLTFLFNLDTANYNIGGSVNQLDSNTVFRTAIANSYFDTFYMQLDAYKIFDESLNAENDPINNASDIQIVKTRLMNNIIYGLSKNIQLMTNIYNSLLTLNTTPPTQTGAKFMFYRLFSVKTGGFDTSSSFNNLSLFTTVDPALSDNFTNQFVLTPMSGEPSNLYHPMSVIVQNLVNQFHLDNRALFRTSLFNDYFNLLFLWGRTDILAANICNQAITGTPGGTIPQVFGRMYFMNYIPLLTNTDIPTAILNILEYEKTVNPSRVAQIQVIINNITPQLNALRTSINSQLLGKICIADDFVTVGKISGYRQIAGPTGDIIICAIIRQNAILPFLTDFLLLPVYIITEYIALLNNFASLLLPFYNQLLPTLIATVNLFATPASSLPSAATYQTQNYNQNTSLPINTQANILSDIPSSIWFNIMNSFVVNYNFLFDSEILGQTFYQTNFGLELTRYLNYLTTTYLGAEPINYYIASTTNNYQTLLPVNSGAIGTYLNTQLSTYNLQLAHYNENRGLLDSKSLIVPKPTFFYQIYNSILDFITLANIEVLRDSSGNLIYYHEPHRVPGETDPVLYIRDSFINPLNPDYDPTVPHNNTMDIINAVGLIFETFITSSTNPFSPITDNHKYVLWNQFQNTFVPNDERIKYNTLYGFINPQSLFLQKTTIDVKYNGFTTETDNYNFMSDVALNSSIVKDIPGLQSNTVINTYQNILSYYASQKLSLRILIAGINSVNIILENSLKAGQPANFAWVQKLGHYMIDYITVKIGDQLIDKHYGEWLEIWHQMTRRDQKERGYKILIGDVPELTTFNTQVKPSYELLIPLKFWFCKEVGGSIPLIALQNTFVEIAVKLKELSEISYVDPFTVFLGNPKLTCKLVSEYIYVEEDERFRIAESKNEYLIETLQFGGDQQYSSDQLTMLPNSFGTIEQKMYFKNPCKELIWVFQNQNFINGSETNGEIKYFNYGYDFTTGKNNPAQLAKIKFSDRDREIYHDINFYNYVQVNERHTSSLSTGINVYSFALNPEQLQPSGSANMGRLDDCSIIMNLKSQVVNDLNAGIKYNWRIYAISYNLLRVMSGFGALSYFY